MSVFIDPEFLKPLRCTACGGARIASMLNEGVIRCLGCGREKADPNSPHETMRRETSGSGNTWSAPANPNPWRDF